MMSTAYAESILKRIIEMIEEKGLHISGRRELKYGWQLLIEDNNLSSLLLNVYHGKNGIRVVPNEPNSFIYLNLSNELQSIVFPNVIPCTRYIGTDESGKGDYFGPLVTAGFFISPENREKLFGLSVRDCKSMDDKAVKELAKLIRISFIGKYNIFMLEPSRYNDLYSHYRLEGRNMNYILGWCHARTIENILEVNNNVEGILADQFGEYECIKYTLSEKASSVKLFQMSHAENDLAVAAASILARDAFLSWLERMSNQYSIVIPKGASAEAEEAAIIIAKKYTPAELKKLCKIHFRTTKKVLEIYKK